MAAPHRYYYPLSSAAKLVLSYYKIPSPFLPGLSSTSSTRYQSLSCARSSSSSLQAARAVVTLRSELCSWGFAPESSAIFKHSRCKARSMTRRRWRTCLDAGGNRSKAARSASRRSCRDFLFHIRKHHITEHWREPGKQSAQFSCLGFQFDILTLRTYAATLPNIDKNT